MRWNWKQSLNLLTLCTVLFILLWMPAPSYAQDYSFTLDQQVVDVWINKDGSVKLEYWFTFTCDRGNYHIAAVDVGLPTGRFSFADIQADVDGRPISYIGSDYQGKGEHGVAVWLGNSTIRSGETATVHVVVGWVGGMVYEDSDDPEYASTQFSPTWFGSQYVHGTTDMVVRFHLPVGVQADEPRWHRSPSGWPQDQPDTGFDAENRVMYTWRNTAARPDRQYTFGASFPRRYVNESAIQKPPSLLSKIWGAVKTLTCNPGTCFTVLLMGIVSISIWSQRRRKMQYLPPTMKVEGVGIKRGLTAVEAAILLETPLDKVLTMILFSLVKKGAITVLDDRPLKVQVSDPLPQGLHSYEEKFLQAVKADNTLSESKLRSAITGLIKAVNAKMKGFSRKESVAYYRDIVRRAWGQVEEAQTPEVRSQRFDEGLEWTMLDDDFDDRTKRVFRTGPVYVPMWWGHYQPWTRQAAVGTAGAGKGSSSTGTGGLPTLPGAAFAASIVGGVENTAGRIVRNVTDFTGGVTQVTNPPPKTSSGGRGSGGGGGGCACACACAGCACACAGGGR